MNWKRRETMTAPGWHPAPTGAPELWYWDGHQWCDPVQQVEEQVTELVIPHLERAYRDGFEAGLKARAQPVIEVKPKPVNSKRRASEVLGWFGVTRENDWIPG